MPSFVFGRCALPHTCTYMYVSTCPFSPQESPLPAAPHMFPTWPAKSEMSRKPKRDKSPTPPEGGAFLINKVRGTLRVDIHYLIKVDDYL